ncbi:carbohydrate esterase family 16 protein, partial [Amanita muscaria Koide BX008]
TGGPYWIDYLTTTYNQSLTLTYNFAVVGSTINASLVRPLLGVTLEDQVRTYLHKFSDKPPSTPWKSSNTLFSIWISINDIGRSYFNPGDRDAFSDLLLDSYFNLVEQLVSSRARLFYFINVPPVNRSPLVRARGVESQDTERAVIQGYNDKLLTRITNFGQNHPDVRTWFWDSHAAFTAILDDPARYGFRDVTSWNPIDPAYFWGNDYHPGSTAHKIFAQEMRNSLQDFPW